MAHVRTHYTYLGLSLARSEGNLFRLNFSTGDIFNSDNVVVGHKNMISKIFGRLYDLAQETIQDLSNGEELDYSVDNARLSDGMVSFTECVRVPLTRDISTVCSRSITTTLTCSGRSISGCRLSSSRSSIPCACRHGQQRSTDYRWRARPRSIGECTFLAPTFGFRYNYNKSANSKDPIIREIGPELSLLFLWYVLVFRRMYVGLSRVKNNAKLYQFDAMLEGIV